MDKLDLGKIPPESIVKVNRCVMNASPLAVTLKYIRLETTVRPESALKILKYLEMLDKVETVKTNVGVFWRWRGNNHGN